MLIIHAMQPGYRLMIENKKLKHFITLAQVGNFNLAADLLHISQPALTRSIQALESQLKLELFDRNQRAIKLTDAGRHLLERAQLVLLSVDNLALEADRYKSLKAGKLVVGTGPLPADHIGAKACAAFLNRFPEMNLHLMVDDPDNIVPKLAKGEVEILLADPRGLKDMTDLDFLLLPAVPAAVIARAGHPLSARSNLTVQDMMPYPLGSISKQSRHVIGKILGLSDPREMATLFNYECNNVQLLLTTVKHSDTIGILLTSNVQEAIQSGELCMLDVPAVNDKEFSQYGILTYRPRLQSLAAEKFIQIVQSVALEQHGTN